MHSKQIRAALLVSAAFAVGLIFSQADASNPLRSPLATPTAQATPDPFRSPIPPGPFDQYYRDNPKKLNPRKVPYTDAYGEVIVEERIVEIPHHEPAIILIKGKPEAKSQNQPDAPSQNAATTLNFGLWCGAV